MDGFDPGCSIPGGTAVDAQTIAELRHRAESGDPDAMEQLASDYANGNGVPKNLGEWTRWERKAAEHGNTAAITELGSWYLAGQRLPQNFPRAFFWLHKAAERGNVIAMCNLGTMYNLGQDIPVDHVEAYFWLNLAAANTPAGANADDLIRERDQAASHLSHAALLAVQKRATKWLDDPPSYTSADEPRRP